MSSVCKPYTKKMTKRKTPPSQAAQMGENHKEKAPPLPARLLTGLTPVQIGIG